MAAVSHVDPDAAQLPPQSVFPQSAVQVAALGYLRACLTANTAQLPEYIAWESAQFSASGERGC
jgi:hypothetical protein